LTLDTCVKCQELTPGPPADQISRGLAGPQIVSLRALRGNLPIFADRPAAGAKKGRKEDGRKKYGENRGRSLLCMLHIPFCHFPFYPSRAPSFPWRSWRLGARRNPFASRCLRHSVPIIRNRFRLLRVRNTDLQLTTTNRELKTLRLPNRLLITGYRLPAFHRR